MGRLLKAINVREALLQVALDFTDLADAFKVIKKLINLDIGIFEVGTPLIKSRGVEAVTAVRSLLKPASLVLADMKTADVGALEVTLAKRAGADITTVLLSSDDEVIKSSLEKGDELDVDIVIDTVGVRPRYLLERLEEVINLGARVINIHTGIDVQLIRGLTARDSADLVRRLKNEYSDLLLSVSGGIKPEEVSLFRSAGASIVVIGSAITKSSDPHAAALKALKLLQGLAHD
ncbi:MAG: orotidine 5'-phosphate decarboxylase / HUMPS family protein [Zestosphaera sp.]